jgi:hypothetical protein
MRVNLIGLAVIIALAGLMQLVLANYITGGVLLVLAAAMVPLQLRRARQFKEYDRRKALDETFGGDGS